MPRLVSPLLFVSAFVACGGPGGSPLPDAGRTDAAMDDARVRCDDAGLCDDGIECTEDLCVDGTCFFQPRHERCANESFCDGRELCDLTRGCTAGLRETCQDNNVCTLDRCDETTKACVRTPRDQDDDGEVDSFCGGSDCNDMEPAMGGSLGERCGDELDNDCDSQVDEANCSTPRYDTCADALDVSAGGLFQLNSQGAARDYEVSCAEGGRRDLVVRFTLAEARSVVLRAMGDSVSYLSLGATCADARTEIECASGFPAHLASLRLEPGDYFAVLGDVGGDVQLEVTFADPGVPPTNAVCANAIDISAGGVFSSSLIDVSDTQVSTCGVAGPDLYYRLHLEESRNVTLSSVHARGAQTTLSLQMACESAASRCGTSSAGPLRLYSLAAGDYVVVLEASRAAEDAVELHVELSEPTPPPLGDTCANPHDLQFGESMPFRMTGFGDDHATTCGFSYREAVHRFSITETSDISVTASSDSAIAVALQTAPCALTGERFCASGQPASFRMRGLPMGTYYLLVESFSGAPYGLEVRRLPPTFPVVVTGNDVCAGAHDVPPEGGIFTGSTRGALPDYSTRLCGGGAAAADVAFRVTLTERRRLVAQTAGSGFDTVLHLHRGECRSGAELQCDDDGGDDVTSLIDTMLDAGTYFIVVDGFGDTVGDYVLQVEFPEP